VVGAAPLGGRVDVLPPFFIFGDAKLRKKISIAKFTLPHIYVDNKNVIRHGFCF